ncbi:MAG: serpin family protein [Bacteroidales bacterium]|nr:serpin family protein [Bacteroidales bacterium]
MIMHCYSIVAAVATMLAAGAACDRIAPENEDDNPLKTVELSSRSSDFVREGKTFTFNYIDRINAESQKDYVISPLSMKFLLGMLLNGAQGATATEISNVLGYGAGETDAVNEYCYSMLTQLPKLDKKTSLSLANAIFVDNGYPLKKAYKSAMAKFYNAEIANLDFRDTGPSTKAINDWCSKNTNGLIPKVIDEVSPDMLAYLLNALYFKSQWKDKFDKAATADEYFTDEVGTKGKVKMMKRYKDCAYGKSEKFQAVRIPYGNGAFSMTVLLPRNGVKVAEICDALAKSNGSILDGLFYTCEVDLWLPKFETKFSINLNDILSEMGMPLSFCGEADFRPMSEYALCLSFVQQDAIIKVDEEGTEAAAISSAGMMKNTSVGPQDSAVFHADHTFLYLITENSTGAVLFAGRYSGK